MTLILVPRDSNYSEPDKTKGHKLGRPLKNRVPRDWEWELRDADTGELVQDPIKI